MKKNSTSKIESKIMSKINEDKLKMKPKWYFILGSFFSIFSLIGLFITALFLFNLSFFLMRQHGPMGDLRLQFMLNSFPVWVPVVAVISLILGAILLRRYDFSYKKNFSIIILAFFSAIILASFFIDYFDLSQKWFGVGPMRRYYQGNENSNYYNFERKFKNKRSNYQFKN